MLRLLLFLGFTHLRMAPNRQISLTMSDVGIRLVLSKSELPVKIYRVSNSQTSCNIKQKIGPIQQLPLASQQNNEIGVVMSSFKIPVQGPRGRKMKERIALFAFCIHSVAFPRLLFWCLEKACKMTFFSPICVRVFFLLEFLGAVKSSLGCVEAMDGLWLAPVAKIAQMYL